MNQENPAGPISGNQFIIAMMGFSDAERSMLISTFRLTGRRDFTYVEPDGDTQRADIYLINADQEQAVAELRAQALNCYAPALLIGRAPVAGEWAFVKKPIHWIRLFETLDELMRQALHARAQRDLNVHEKWDGETFRRSIDKHRVTPNKVLPSRTQESVLVVDDSATVRAFMRIKLAPFHFDVDYAENGEQAIAMALAKPYTCIFLDILMPGIDGYEVCKRIKGDNNTKKTAVVMLSSKTSMFDKIRGSWAGCDAYLGKPVSEDNLLATVAKFLPSARS